MTKGLYLFFVMTMFSRSFNMDQNQIIHRIEDHIKENTQIVDLVKEEEKTYTISLAGDMLMVGSVGSQIQKYGYGYPYEMVKEYFLGDDLTIANLETSLTTRGELWPDKEYNFRSHPDNVQAMIDGGIDVVSLANNHTLDYGYEGFVDTLGHLDKHGLKRVGGGKNKEDATRAIIVEKEGIKIGVLAFSRVIPHVDWYALNKRPGLVGAYDVHVPDVIRTIEDLKKEVDLVVVSIHWGQEYAEYPRDKEMDLGRKLVDYGADIVMGHHPHVLQGIEIYKDRPIFYSLGNFIFGTRTDLASNTMIGQVHVRKKKPHHVRVIPGHIVNGRPEIAEGEAKTKKIKYLNDISKVFNTKIDEDGIIQIVIE